MPFDVFCNMTLTAALTVWSPGPNNILLLTTASKYGFRKNLKFQSSVNRKSYWKMLKSIITQLNVV